jgi:hypothetical protein
VAAQSCSSWVSGAQVSLRVLALVLRSLGVAQLSLRSTAVYALWCALLCKGDDARVRLCGGEQDQPHERLPRVSHVAVLSTCSSMQLIPTPPRLIHPVTG